MGVCLGELRADCVECNIMTTLPFYGLMRAQGRRLIQAPFGILLIPELDRVVIRLSRSLCPVEIRALDLVLEQFKTVVADPFLDLINSPFFAGNKQFN